MRPGAAPQPPPPPPPPPQAAASRPIVLSTLPCGTSWEDAIRDSPSLTVKAGILGAHSGMGGVYPDPSVPITVFAVSDRAFYNVAAGFGAAGDVGTDLVRLEQQLPRAKIASMWLFRSLPQAYSLGGLRGLGSNVRTGLAEVTGDKALVLNFEAVNVGGSLVSLSTVLVDDLLASVQATPAVNVTKVCNSYLFTVDQYLWPGPSFTLAAIPDPVRGGKYSAAQNETQPLPDPATVFTAAARASMPVPYAGRTARIVGGVIGAVAGAALVAAVAAFLWRRNVVTAAAAAKEAGRTKGVEEGMARSHASSGATPPLGAAELASILSGTTSGSMADTSARSGVAGLASPHESALAAALGGGDWQLGPSRVKPVSDPDGAPVKLGEGGFGSVYLAELDGTTRVAVKLVSGQAPREAARFAREVALLKSLHHGNIIQFMGAFLGGDGTLALVLEHAQRGDLHRALGRDFGREYGWPRRGRGVALDIARAVVYMHSRSPPVVHLVRGRRGGGGGGRVFIPLPPAHHPPSTTPRTSNPPTCCWTRRTPPKSPTWASRASSRAPTPKSRWRAPSTGPRPRQEKEEGMVGE